MSEESDRKTALVKAFRKAGHYGKRVEDKYQVGFPDLVLVPNGYPVFMCEAKIIRNKTHFDPTERQLEELRRLSKSPKHVIPCMLGFDGDEMYLHPPADRAKISDCVVKEADEHVVDFFKRFYHQKMEI